MNENVNCQFIDTSVCFKENDGEEGDCCVCIFGLWADGLSVSHIHERTGEEQRRFAAYMGFVFRFM